MTEWHETKKTNRPDAEIGCFDEWKRGVCFFILHVLGIFVLLRLTGAILYPLIHMHIAPCPLIFKSLEDMSSTGNYSIRSKR